MDPQLQAWLDQEDARTSEVIRRHGWQITYVHAGSRKEAAFGYTVGLFGLGHPELLLLGTCHHAVHHVLDEFGRRVLAGENFVAGQRVDDLDWGVPVVLEHVPNPGDIVFSANRFYCRPDEVSVPVLQVSYADTRGRFPWEAGYRTADGLQPRPGTFRA